MTRRQLAAIGAADTSVKKFAARPGKPFVHAGFVTPLTDSRDRRKLGLSEHPAEGGTPVAELAQKMEALRAANTVEAAPERVGTLKAARGERPVTTRGRERREVVESRAEAVASVAGVIALPDPAKPMAVYRQVIVRSRSSEAQMRLF